MFGSELTVPYYAFLDAGMEVDVASPRGGDIPFDPTSFRPPIRTTEDDRYLDDPVLQDLCENSLAIGDLDMSTYDIVFFAGGWGAAWDLGRSEVVGEQASAAIANDAVIGGVCHGPLGLLQATNPDGTLFVEGRRLTAVTDRQVKQLGISHTRSTRSGSCATPGRCTSRPATSAAMPSPTMSWSTATSSPVRTRTPGRWSLAR